MPFLSAAPLSEKNPGSVPGTSLPVVIVKSLCFCHPTEDNKYPHLKVPQEGLKNCTFLMKQITTFHCLHEEDLKIKVKWCFHAKNARLC